MNLNLMEFRNMQEAWMGINEYLALKEVEILEKGGGLVGPEFLSYNNLIIIKRARIDSQFDFGFVLGYSTAKWRSLVNNYVDFNFLDELRNEIASREKKRAKNYNLAYHFANHHTGGKDCLISLTFSRRLYSDRPIVNFNIRTSEVTKRLIFDLLLVQRIVEYVYGHNKVEVQMYIPSMFLTAEGYMMYNNVKPIMPLFKALPTLGKFQKKLVECYKHYLKVDPSTIKYKVNQRSALQLQKDKNGWPLSGVKSMQAKNMHLPIPTLRFPAEVLAPSEERRYKKEQANKLQTK